MEKGAPTAQIPAVEGPIVERSLNRVRAMAVIGVTAAAGLMAGVVVGGGEGRPVAEAPEAEVPFDEAPVETDPAACADTWAVQELESDNHQVVDGGMQLIRDVDTPEEGRDAVMEFIRVIKTDPERLAGVSNAILDGADVAPESLHAEGCMTPAAEQRVAELEGTLMAASVTPDVAPSNAYNTGIDANGYFVRAASAGISGDRDAVRVELEDGDKFWLMARCANLAFEAPPAIPEGPTDETPDTPTTTTPSTTTTTRPETTTTAPPKVDDGEIPGPGGTTQTTVEGPSGVRRDDPAEQHPTTSTTSPESTTSTTANTSGSSSTSSTSSSTTSTTTAGGNNGTTTTTAAPAGEWRE